VKTALRVSLTQCAPFSSLSEPFSRVEIDTALSDTKAGKAAGVNGILLDFLKNLGPRGRDWLAALFAKIFSSFKLPKIWRKSKIIAILKPGKPANDPKGYRPIALLCTTYKLLEWMPLTRLAPYFEREIPEDRSRTKPTLS
uniref:Reverse transcriptase domain-containing protein n=1 Tax=Latimeria chalumnae TaxID=7897 RepID=H3B757_LATCH